jgi:hypothetical protein
MRLLACMVATLALTPTPGQAQMQGASPTWHLGLGVRLESVRFSRALVDASAPSSEAAGLRPSGGIGIGLALSRSSASWRVELAAGWAGVRPQADNANLAITDKTTRLTRWRLGAAAERRLCSVGSGELALGAGPALDWWRVTGDDRVRLGGQGTVALRLPLGRWELENRLGLGVSGGPFVSDDAGAQFESRTLVSLILGIGVRAPL